MNARISKKIVVTAAGGPGRARRQPTGRMWPSANQVSQMPRATSGRLSQLGSGGPPTRAETPAASASGQPIASSVGRATGGKSRKTGQASASAMAASGTIEKNAQRQPAGAPITTPYDGPSRPGRIQAPASNASTRARPDSG